MTAELKGTILRIKNGDGQWIELGSIGPSEGLPDKGDITTLLSLINRGAYPHSPLSVWELYKN